MRIFSSLVAVAILTMAVLAAQQTLAATIPSDASSFRIANCNNVDGPSKKSLTISVNNPLESYMSVKYYVYNLTSGQWEDKGKLCNAPGSGVVTQCAAILEITAGNQGNGTITNDLVRVVATIEGSQDTYEKVFSFTVNHFTGEREAILLSQLSTNNTALAAAREQCAAKPACCTTAVSGKLDSAQASFGTVTGAISGCHLLNAYDVLVQGETNVKNVTSTLRPCALSGTPTPVGTPHVTPQPTGSVTPSGQTPTPIPTPTPSPTPTPAPASSCPLGALLALLGVGLFAFRR